MGTRSGVDGTLDVTPVDGAGAAASSGNGVADAGTMRVTVASDSTGQMKLAAGANTVGALAANQSVNLAQVNGVVTSMGTGSADTGTQRAVLSSDGLSLVSVPPYANGAIPLTGNGSGAASSVTQNLAAAAGKTTYMAGFDVTGLGATAATSVNISVYLAGNGKNLGYTIAVPAGVTAAMTPLMVRFNPPISAGAANSVIQTTLPSFGAGNTLTQLNVFGFQL